MRGTLWAGWGLGEGMCDEGELGKFRQTPLLYELTSLGKADSRKAKYTTKELHGFIQAVPASLGREKHKAIRDLGQGRNL